MAEPSGEKAGADLEAAMLKAWDAERAHEDQGTTSRRRASVDVPRMSSEEPGEPAEGASVCIPCLGPATTPPLLSQSRSHAIVDGRYVPGE